MPPGRRGLVCAACYLEGVAGSFVSYLIRGADDSRYHARHWFRFLSKAISRDGSKLSSEDVAEIIASGQLTAFQMVTLQLAQELDGPVFEAVAGLREPRRPNPAVAALIARERAKL